MFSAIIFAVALTGQSGIGEPPANASPELKALYKQANAEAARASAPAPVAPSRPATPPVAFPVRKPVRSTVEPLGAPSPSPSRRRGDVPTQPTK